MDLCEAPDLSDLLLIQPGWNVVGRGGALGVGGEGNGVRQSWAQSQFCHCLAQTHFLHLQSGTSNKIPDVELVQDEVSRSWASHAHPAKTVVPFGLWLEP